MSEAYVEEVARVVAVQEVSEQQEEPQRRVQLRGRGHFVAALFLQEHHVEDRLVLVLARLVRTDCAGLLGVFEDARQDDLFGDVRAALHAERVRLEVALHGDRDQLVALLFFFLRELRRLGLLSALLALLPRARVLDQLQRQVHGLQLDLQASDVLGVDGQDMSLLFDERRALVEDPLELLDLSENAEHVGHGFDDLQVRVDLLALHLYELVVGERDQVDRRRQHFAGQEDLERDEPHGVQDLEVRPRPLLFAHLRHRRLVQEAQPVFDDEQLALAERLSRLHEETRVELRKDSAVAECRAREVES